MRLVFSLIFLATSLSTPIYAQKLPDYKSWPMVKKYNADSCLFTKGNNCGRLTAESKICLASETCFSINCPHCFSPEIDSIQIILDQSGKPWLARHGDRFYKQRRSFLSLLRKRWHLVGTVPYGNETKFEKLERKLGVCSPTY